MQVQQVKKVAKFACTLCGAKQSVRQVYAISSKASDVRGVVVSLNARRQAADDAQDNWAPEDDATQPAAPSVLKPQVDWTHFVEQVQFCSVCALTCTFDTGMMPLCIYTGGTRGD